LKAPKWNGLRKSAIAVKVPDHLGGHGNKTHIDDGALKCIMSHYSIKSILDIGCGPGGMKKVAEDNDVEWTGIDGDPTQNTGITHDYTKGISPVEGKFDLGWSIEFLEHVKEQYQPYYMADFSRCKYVLASASPPGSKGHHHVNCQRKYYWMKVFSDYGFKRNIAAEREVQAASTIIKQRFTKNFMFYES
jgi:cyclopropane fatty-acyl-phospholipid synthase-like methyltransferase